MSEENTDLENEESKTFTQEQVNEILEKQKAEYAGMEKNYSNLLSETKEAKRIAKEEAEKAQILKEQEASKKGEFESLSKMQAERHELELKALNEKLQSRDAEILGSKNDLAINGLADLFKDESKVFSKATLSNMVETKFNESGKPTTIYKDLQGNVLGYDNPDIAKNYLDSEAIFQPHLKGIQMNGGGRRSDNGASGAKSQTNNAAEDAKKRGDVAGFLNAKMKNKT